MFVKKVTIHFNEDDRKPVQALATFGEGPFYGGGYRLLSLSYNCPVKRIREDRPYSWNGFGDDWSDINSMISGGAFFGRSEFDRLRLEVSTEIRKI